MEEYPTVPEVQVVFPYHLNPEERIKVSSIFEALPIIRSAWDVNKIDVVEQVRVLYLDDKLRCMGQALLATGYKDSCELNRRMIFASAMKADASFIILAHNHPSGKAIPSTADIRLTQQLVEDGKFVDVGLIDHVILTRTNHFSFRDEGLILQ